MALTGRTALLAGLAALVVATVAPSVWGVVAVEAVLALLVGVDVALAGSPRALRLWRDGDTRVRLGERALVRLVVTNTGAQPVRGLLRDAWPPSAGAVPVRWRIRIPPGERRVFEVTLTPTRRGDRPAAQVTVRSIGPLGLAGRQRGLQAPWTVRALPPFASRRHLPSRLARLRDLDGRQALLVRGAGTEFDSLRAYVAGDDVRSIDWRATARAGGVVVRTWRPERDRHVLLVLDVGRTAATRVGDAPRLDASLDAALLLGALAVRAGDRVDLLAIDRTVRADVRRSTPTELLPAFVNAMATLEPALVETDYRRLVSEATARAGRSSLVVLLTGLEAAPVAEGLVPVLGPLLRRHTVLVAAVADPSVATMARARDDSAAVYSAAAAEQALAERDQVAGLLRRRGVHVVDEPPERLPPALADAYLDLKAAGLL
jgi:uncharacterized protein (DUF58 family)